MKAVLISIRPQWCDKIASGKKIIEVRKSMPKLERPFKCYIYMSQGDLKDLGSYSEWIYKNRMKVIGEFICDKVYNLVNAFGGIMFADENLNQLDPQLFRDMSCLTDEQTADYLGDKDGYGLHIIDLKIYDNPKELSEFRGCNFKSMNGTDVCGNYDCQYYQDSGSYMIPPSCAKNGCRITRPPRSWCYVKSEQ